MQGFNVGNTAGGHILHNKILANIATQEQANRAVEKL
jgi:hypothetical protein